MSDLGNLGTVAGAHSAFNRSTPGARTEQQAPATVENAVGQPINTPQKAVTQPPTAGNVEWKRRADAENQPQRTPAAAPDREQLTATLKSLNQRLRDYQTNLQFDMDDQYQQIVVRIVDRETQEVVRQIPSESALALAKAFEDLEVRNQGVVSQGNPRLQVEGWLLQATA